jgi:hypothetical protein
MVLLFSLLVYLFPQQTGAPARGKTLVVSKLATGENAFTSILSAIRAARSGDVVELADESWEENVDITAKIHTAGITLRAAPGKKVIWTFKPGQEKKPLLMLSGARDFTLNGEGITLDGKGKMSQLVLLTGVCPGLTISQLQLKGYQEHGVKIMNCAGQENKNVRLSHLWPDQSAPEKSFAIYLDANSQVSPNQNNFIDLSACLAPNFSSAKFLGRKDANVVGTQVTTPPDSPW